MLDTYEIYNLELSGDEIKKRLNAIDNFKIDNTLNISGQAADAKVTGDAINNLTSEINNINNNTLTNTIANNIYSNALKKSINNQVIRIDDISPIQHTVPVKVSGADKNTVVKAQGKNLLKPSDYLPDSNSTTLDGDVFTTNFTHAGYFFNTGWNTAKTKTMPKGTYTVTFIPVSEDARATIHIRTFANQTLITSLQNAGTDAVGYSVTFTTNEEWFVSLSGASSSLRGTHSYRMQIEVGTTATEYEPYIEPVHYPVSEDGTCEATSIAPTMTLTTNKDGAVMDCEYNQNTRDAIKQEIKASNGTYELIEEVTLEEAVTKIRLNYDPNRYSRMFVNATLATSLVGGTSNQVNFTFSNEHGTVGSTAGIGSSTSGERWPWAECYLRSGRWICEWVNGTSKWGNSVQAYSSVNTRMVCDDTAKRTDLPYIVDITSTVTDVPIPAGSVFRIYGVEDW